MTHHPSSRVSIKKLSSVEAKMHEGDFRATPVVRGGSVTGIITERDLRRFHGKLEAARVKDAMTEHVITITSEPVVEGDKLLGMFTITGLLQAFTETESD